MEKIVGNILAVQLNVMTSDDRYNVKEAVVTTTHVLKKGTLDKDLDGKLMDLSFYLDVEGKLPFIPKNVPLDVKQVMDTFLTNEISRKAKSRLPDFKIKSFLAARNDVIEFSRSNDEVDDFINSLDLVIRNDGGSVYTETFDVVHDAEKDLKVENYDLIVTSTPVFVITIPSSFIPVNESLEAGETLALVSIPRENDLADELLNKKLTSVDAMSKETIVFTDDGRYYLVDFTADKTAVIRKFSLEEFSSTEKIV